MVHEGREEIILTPKGLALAAIELRKAFAQADEEYNIWLQKNLRGEK